MRAVRLRSRAIGRHARPETDAALTTLAFAPIAAAGVFLPWAEGIGWSKRGWEYGHGVVATAAAVVSAVVCVFRLRSVIDRRSYLAAALTGALIGLGATLWFYFDVVGSNDPVKGLFSLFRPVRQQGAIGLYVSMAGFLAQAAVLVWHADSRVRRHVRTALRSPWTSAALASVAAAGVSWPWRFYLNWAGIYPSPARAWSSEEGLIALVAAIAVAVVCGLRLSGRMRLVPYLALGLLWAAIGFGAIVSFRIHDYPTFYPLLVSWLNAPRTDTGPREAVSAAAFTGLMAVLVWQLWQGRREFR